MWLGLTRGLVRNVLWVGLVGLAPAGPGLHGRGKAGLCPQRDLGTQILCLAVQLGGSTQKSTPKRAGGGKGAQSPAMPGLQWGLL